MQRLVSRHAYFDGPKTLRGSIYYNRLFYISKAETLVGLSVISALPLVVHFINSLQNDPPSKPHL
jgi:hypothetical protein